MNDLSLQDMVSHLVCFWHFEIQYALSVLNSYPLCHRRYGFHFIIVSQNILIMMTGSLLLCVLFIIRGI